MLPDPLVELARAQLRRSEAPIHFMGVGGVGMAGLAVLLKSRGYAVSGCDASVGTLLPWLQARGIPCTTPHDPAHLQDPAGWMVRSAAVPDDHPELEAARLRNWPILPRGAVLAAALDGRISIAVSGTHGKTTTTTMITQVLKAGGFDPGFAIGAEVEALGGVADAGRGEILVVEADESDGTVAGYETDYAVLTNAELDHVDHFGSLRAVCECFTTYGQRARRAMVVCGEDPIACRAADGAARVIRYGFASGLDWRATSIREEGLATLFEVRGPSGRVAEVRLPVPGRHQILNALAAFAVATDLGMPVERVAAALGHFSPPRRRFEQVATGSGITVISDYAHHPTEIRALLSQARRLRPKRIIAVFQPHRYSRTRAFAAEFAEAFSGVGFLVLAPVYAASEPQLKGGRSEDVFPLFALHHPGHSALALSLHDAAEQLFRIWKPGDLVLIVGAGDVEKVAFDARSRLQFMPPSPTPPP